MTGPRIVTAKLRMFSRDEHGGIAMIFAITAMVMIAMIGLVIDYSRAVEAKTTLQASIDSAALAAGIKAKQEKNISDGELKSFVLSYLKDQPSSHIFEKIKHVDVKTLNNDIMHIEALGQIKNLFGQIFSMPTMDVSAHARVDRRIGGIEVAMVLDTTSSMSGTKIESLKSSAKLFVDSLTSEVSNTKIAIVPFAQYVNVGLEYRSYKWLDVPNDYSEVVEQCTNNREILEKTNCRTVTATGYNDGVPYEYTYEQCDIIYGPDNIVCSDLTVNHVWRGCVGSRNHPLNVEDTSPSTPIPGLLDAWCGKSLQPLTDVKTTLYSKIDSLNATGNTYIPAGLMWGWRVLSKDVPFTEGLSAEKAAKEGVRKVVVLMTDGFNTLKPYYPRHGGDGQDSTIADGLTSELCTNIKAASIDIYAVTYDVTDAGVKDLLRNCSSGPDYYFDATGSNQLAQTFQKIADSITPLRLVE